MEKESDRKRATSDSRWMRELDHLLSAGVKHGPTGVHEAIERVLRLATGLTPGDCWRRIRYLRRHIAPSESGQAEHQSRTKDKRSRRLVRQSNRRRPWTKQEDKDLQDLAGYESVKRLSERLNRSKFAIRCRLSELGIRGRVRDAWSLRRLEATFHVGRRTLLGWIAKGQLSVIDSRITRKSLLRLFQDYRASFSSAAEQRLLNSCDEAYTWKQVEQIFEVGEEQVRRWIASGKVRIVNPSVTERALGRFCKAAPAGLNLSRIDAEELEWLIEEYGLKAKAASDIESDEPDEGARKAEPAS
jgi:hypothetical protein